MNERRNATRWRPWAGVCLGLTLLTCPACGTRPVPVVGVRAPLAAGLAGADSTSFAAGLERFLALPPAERQQARASVAADLAAWREFEAIVETREDRRRRPFIYEDLPADRRRLGHGLVPARAALQAVVAADPAAVEAWAGLARYSQEVGDLAGARRQLEHAFTAARARAAAGEPVPREVLLSLQRERAWLLRDLGLWEQGLAAAAEGLQAFPGDHDLTMARGLLLAGAGRFSEAISLAARLPATDVYVRKGPQANRLRMVPSDFASQWIRATAYAAQGDLELAFHLLGEDPDDAERATYVYGGTQDRKLGTITTMPRQVHCWNDVGMIAEALGAESAVDYYTRAWGSRRYRGYYPAAPSGSGPLVLDLPQRRTPFFTSFFGRHFLAGSRLAYVTAIMNRISLASTDAARRELAASARQCLDILERRRAWPAVCHALRGRLHYRLEEWDAARHHLAQARGTFNETGRIDPRTSLLLGMLDLRDQRFASAAVLFRESLAADPEQALGWRMLGVALANCERGDEAAAAMDRALQLEPASLAGRYNRGLLMLQQQRCHEALADLDLALRLDPGNEDLVRLLQLATVCGQGEGAESRVVRAAGAASLGLEADTRQLVRQLGSELAEFFAAPDSSRERLETRLALLQEAAAATDPSALRAAQAILLADLGRPAEARNLLVGAWPEGLRPPEDLILLYTDWRSGDRTRLRTVVADALDGNLQTSNPYIWALVVMEIQRDPVPWGDDAAARVLARWSDQPSGLSGSTIRYWTDVMSQELAIARGGRP